MWGIAVRMIIQVLAGVGVAKLSDKIAPDKVPNYEPVSPISGVFSPVKIAFFVGSMVIGALITKWIGKKFNIKLLK